MRQLDGELAQAIPVDSQWWEALFTGYGRAPNFDAFRLRLLSVAPMEFRLAGH